MHGCNWLCIWKLSRLYEIVIPGSHLPCFVCVTGSTAHTIRQFVMQCTSSGRSVILCSVSKTCSEYPQLAIYLCLFRFFSRLTNVCCSVLSNWWLRVGIFLTSKTWNKILFYYISFTHLLLDKGKVDVFKKSGAEIGKNIAQRSGGLFSAEDWQCKMWGIVYRSAPVCFISPRSVQLCRCGNINWARRTDCNVCKHPKYARVEARTGECIGWGDVGMGVLSIKGKYLCCKCVLSRKLLMFICVIPVGDCCFHV